MVDTALACLALVSTFALIGALLPWLHARVLVHPNQRSSHVAPTPQGAGIAVVVVVLALCGVLVAAGWLPLGPLAKTAFTLAVGLVALCAIGVADDIGEVAVGVRLAGQAIAVVALVMSLPAEFRLLPTWVPGVVERATLAFAGLWFVNLFNFMDGIDWITFVETSAIAGGIYLLSLSGRAGQAAGTTAAILIGATAGFAIWNRPRAAVFLGDAGSLPMGLLLVWLMIDTALRGAWAAVLLFSLYYWADATVTLLRRIARGEPFLQAHRQHFYQQATRPQRMSVPRTLALIAATDGTLVVLGIAAEMSGRLPVKLGALAIGALVVGLLLAVFADRRPRVALQSDGRDGD